MHNQNRWYYFHQKAVANGELTADDVFLPVIPTPFGFGIWTSHTTPIHLGATTVRTERFDPAATCAAVARHRATVLCCVSTQFAMILADPASRDYDLSSLRVVFTGGEPLPYAQAARFEELTGVTILQFYGSNETGMLSATTLADPLDRRLRTAGRIVPEMQVRLFDGDRDVTESGRGQPACRGPALSLGYLGGTDHDKLFTKDGWMRMGDICELDADGYLTLAGRTSDFILRGGKNISAVQVEEAVATHPAVAVGRGRSDARPGLRRAGLRIRRAQGEFSPRAARTHRAPREAGCFQGAVARATRGSRRTAAVIRRQDRKRPTSRSHSIDTGRAMSVEDRRGGLEVWAPSKVPAIGVDLSEEQQMAIAFRHLADVGIAENMAGHITWQPDGRSDMYVNPWGLWWQELTASDICVVDDDARVVSGRWDVTPAIHIHTELHRQRPDARVVVHNHPYYVSLHRRPRHASRPGPPDRSIVPRRHVSRREV